MALEFGNPKLSPWLEHKRKNKKQTNRITISSLREQDFLNNAKKDGLIKVLSSSDICKQGLTYEDKCSTDPALIFTLNLSYSRIECISLIRFCERLTICILNDNFIHDINPLKDCSNLLLADLHSNQIHHLPNEDFWSSLTKLTVLYLHNNNIFELHELKYLGFCSSLCSLTLYDTPISLKKNYRHCVVNAVWSLKALDYFVVSDEEIIEDASFLPQFKPLQPHMQYHSEYMRWKLKKSPANGKEIRSIVRKEVAAINRLQAKWSPVLIVQKVIRGFLIRLRYCFIKDTRLWAAVTIQRFFRKTKGLPNPPPSPNILYNDVLQQSLSSMRLDFEAYLKLKRSMQLSSQSITSEQIPRHKSTLKKIVVIPSDTSEMPELLTYGKSGLLHKRISVDLEKLHGKTPEILKRNTTPRNSPDDLLRRRSPMVRFNVYNNQSHHTAPVDKALVQSAHNDVNRIANELGLNTVKSEKRLKSQLKIGKYYTQHEFLGEVPQRDVIIEENPFRLTINPPLVMKRDALEELVLRTVEGADDIRKSVKRIDHQRKYAKVPRKTTIRKNQLNADQKFYLKTQGAMNLSCFHAVDKAYRDRDNAEKVLLRMNHVNKINNVEKKSKDKIKEFKRNYRQDAIARKRQERVTILQALSNHRNAKEDELDTNAAKRLHNQERQQRKKDNFKFAVEFNCQNASVGKALALHDMNVRHQECIDKNVQYVSNMKEELESKKALVDDYMNNKKITQQVSTMNMKIKLKSELTYSKYEREESLSNFLASKDATKSKVIITPVKLSVKRLRHEDVPSSLEPSQESLH